MNNINGYDLSRAWFDWCFENPEKISPNHTALYFFIIEHCNRLGWKRKFGLPTTMAKEAIGIRSYNTYKRTLDELVEFGFVELIEISKNQYSSNIVALSNFDNAPNKALDKALIKHTSKQSESTNESISSIDKQRTKNNRTKNNSAIDAKETILSFEEFWNMYDRKVGKPKAEKLYAKISEADRAEIKNYIPKYIIATPDKEYRKHPQTFLRNRGWEDEIITKQKKHDTNRRNFERTDHAAEKL